MNAIRAHLGKFGIVVSKGIHSIGRLLGAAREVRDALDRETAVAAVAIFAEKYEAK